MNETDLIWAEVTQEELQSIYRERENAARILQERAERKERQANCVHNFRYDGHGHCDDAYVCTKCGLLEWR